ncbi:MAG: chemotaxis protein CheW [Desulfuromonas sp.]|nr:MAG: chemotaxis protein CheW [Desulfuromonas sp.]
MNTAENQSERQQYLTFRLGEEIFAVDVTQVREILDLIPITRVPQMPEFMLGVINLRGSVVPVINLRRKFRMEQVENTRESCIIVLEIQLEGEQLVIGALADSVQEVLELGEEQIEPAPRIGTRLNTEFIRGMGKKEDDFLIILDIDRVFSSDELARVQDVGELAEEG